MTLNLTFKKYATQIGGHEDLCGFVICAKCNGLHLCCAWQKHNLSMYICVAGCVFECDTGEAKSAKIRHSAQLQSRIPQALQGSCTLLGTQTAIIYKISPLSLAFAHRRFTFVRDHHGNHIDLLLCILMIYFSSSFIITLLYRQKHHSQKNKKFAHGNSIKHPWSHISHIQCSFL